MSRARPAHDPLIDTFEESDEENGQEIINSNISQQQIEITVPSQESASLLGGYNGDSIMESGSLQFKKNNYSGNFGTGLSMDSDPMSTFPLGLENLPDRPLPPHSPDADRFSVSAPDSLPPIVMELDSPIHEIEYPSKNPFLDQSFGTKGDMLNTPKFKNLRMLEISSESDLETSQNSQDNSITNAEFMLAEPEERASLCQQVTFSQSDIFASQPHTFGSELKELEATEQNKESVTVAGPTFESGTLLQTERPLLQTPKRKRDSVDQEMDVRAVKKVTFDETRTCDLNESVEVVYEKKPDALGSQDVHLYLESQSQGFSQTHISSSNHDTCLTLPARELESRCSPAVMHSQAPDVQPLVMEPLRNCSANSIDIEQEWLPSSEKGTDVGTALVLSSRQPTVTLPDIDTPTSITPDDSESIFSKALKAAHLRKQNGLESISNDKSPSKSPYQLFRKPSKECVTNVLAEDSEEEVKCEKVNANFEHEHVSSTSQNDTDVEVIVDKSSIRNVNDLLQGKWTMSAKIRKEVEIVQWINPGTNEVVYSLTGDDTVLKDTTFVEKLMDIADLKCDSSRSSRMSNMSSLSGLTTSSSLYFGDKSSSSSAPSFNSTRRSMASVISLSPPQTKPSTLPPLFNAVNMCDTGCQTEPSETDLSSKPESPTHTVTPRTRKARVIRGRSRAKKVSQPTPTHHTVEPTIPEKDEIIADIPAVVVKDETENVFLVDLPRMILDKLKACAKPLSYEDDQVFLQQNAHIATEQLEYVKNKVRELNVSPGMMVFAKYSIDKNFYSGVIEKQDRLDRWTVRYNLDDQLSSVREVFILPTEVLPKGFSVYVRQYTKENYEPGVVKGHLLKDVLLHTVELRQGTVVNVPHSHIVLKESQANLILDARTSYRSLVSSAGSDVAWQNIVMPTKRRAAVSPQVNNRKKPDSNFDSSAYTDDQIIGRVRKPSRRTKAVVTLPGTDSYSDSDSSVHSLASPKPTKARKGRSVTPKTARTPKGSLGPPSAQQLTMVAEIEPAPSPLKLNSQLNPVVKLNLLDQPDNSPTTTPSKKSKRTPSSKPPKKVKKIEIDNQELYGPLPEEGSKIFEGYSILITCANSIKHKEADLEVPPLDKDYTAEQFIRGGGLVLSSFDELQISRVQEANQRRTAKGKRKLSAEHIFNATCLPASLSPATLFCISNATCRTSKFIQCLTVGIPVVNAGWITISCKQNRSMNWLDHLLPAGLSLLTGNMMEQPFNDALADIHSNVGRVVDILRGEKVFLASSTNPQFKDLWLELLATAEAQVFTMSEKGNLIRLLDRNTSVVLADKSIPKEELKRADQLKIPVVSSEWYMQSLFNRCKLEYGAHQRFRYDSVDEALS